MRRGRLGAGLTGVLLLGLAGAAVPVVSAACDNNPTPVAGLCENRATFGNPTGPTPVAGGINAEAVRVAGTPVILSTPQPTSTPQTIPAVGDITALLQTDINAGGRILLPAGTFTVSSALTVVTPSASPIKGSLTVCGMGKDTTTLNYTGSGQLFVGTTNVDSFELCGMTLDLTGASAVNTDIFDMQGGLSNSYIHDLRVTVNGQVRDGFKVRGAQGGAQVYAFWNRFERISARGTTLSGSAKATGSMFYMLGTNGVGEVNGNVLANNNIDHFTNGLLIENGQGNVSLGNSYEDTGAGAGGAAGMVGIKLAGTNVVGNSSVGDYLDSSLAPGKHVWNTVTAGQYELLTLTSPTGFVYATDYTDANPGTGPRIQVMARNAVIPNITGGLTIADTGLTVTAGGIASNSTTAGMTSLRSNGGYGFSQDSTGGGNSKLAALGLSAKNSGGATRAWSAGLNVSLAEAGFEIHDGNSLLFSLPYNSGLTLAKGLTVTTGGATISDGALLAQNATGGNVIGANGISGTTLSVNGANSANLLIYQDAGTNKWQTYLDGSDVLWFFDSGGANRFGLKPSGGAQIGVPTGGDKGAGTINAAGAIYAGGNQAISATGIPQIGATSTFASGDTTMTNANTFYTALTGPTLVASGSYLLGMSALYQDAGVAGDTGTCEIRDSTNNVTVWTGEATATASLNKTLTISSPEVLYSGYSGTPVMIVRCESSGAADKILQSATGSGAAASKATAITAVRAG